MRLANPFLLFAFLSGCSSWLDLGSNESDPRAPDPNASGNAVQGLCAQGSTARETLVTEEPNVRISGLTHDEEFVYYRTVPNYGSPKTVVKRVPLAGGAPEELARLGPGEGIIVAGDFIYWSAPRADLSAYDLVRLSRKTGSSPEVMTHARDWPIGNFARDDAGNVYFTNVTKHADDAPKVIRIAPDGTRTVLLTEGTTDVGSFAVAKNALFWSIFPDHGKGEIFSDAVIYALEPTAKESKLVYGPVPKSTVDAMAADDATIWFARTIGLARKTEILSMPRSRSTTGNEPKVIASDQASPRDLRLDHGVAYWLTAGEYISGKNGLEPTRPGTIVRVRGETIDVLENDLMLPTHLDVTRCSVVWDQQVGTSTAIFRRAK